MRKDVGDSSSSSYGSTAAAARKYGCLYRCFFLVLALTFVVYNTTHIPLESTSLDAVASSGLLTDTIASATASAQDKRQASIKQSSPSIRLSSPDADSEETVPSKPGKTIHRSRESFPEDAEMGWDQVESILSTLPEDGNLLVWGLGRESVFWNEVTTGRVMFLEDGNVNSVNGQRQFDVITEANPQLEAYAIDYTTTNSKESFRTFYNHSDDHLKIKGFPNELFAVPWDVILVDAPLGYPNQGPGRYQSLYTTKLLAQATMQQRLLKSRTSQPNTIVHVFVDDYERFVERKFSQNVFAGAPVQVVARPARDDVNANQQAHFVLHSDGLTMRAIRNASGTALPTNTTASWVVLVEVSDGFYDFFVNWLSFYQKLHLGLRVVVIAEDDMVHDKLQREISNNHTSLLSVVRSAVVLDQSAGFDYNTTNYKAMVSARPLHILHQLRQGRHVIYSDIDTVWRSSPLPFLSSVMAEPVHDALFQVDLDESYIKPHYKPFYCTGFMALRTNRRTRKLMVEWQRALRSKPDLNQPVFNNILRQKSDVRHAPLPRDTFPNGRDYFVNYTSAQRQATVIVHNNFIIGRDIKRDRFIEHGLWSAA
jgi:Nucleotide-diphospho-sugar transferase/Polysaccharide biosynthesis